MPDGAAQRRQVAVYDLDGTVLRRSSFTPFLLFAARCRQPWRLAFAPAWFGAMALYKFGCFSRGALKQFGLRLFLGRRVTEPALRELSHGFADLAIPAWVAPGAAAAIRSDRAEGRVLVLATAAMEFYAVEIARRLGFDHVVASRIEPLGTVGSTCKLQGENCYGPAKRARVDQLFTDLGWQRPECFVRFYTDSVADAPLLDRADEPILVNAAGRARRIATRRGWKLRRFH
jgi:phosphoserine phosphatase